MPSDPEGDSSVLQKGQAHGCQFKVVQVRDQHFCGYVRTTLGPQWDYSDLGGFPSVIDAHGGLTYGVDEGGWIGFDCAHAGDVCVLEDEVQTDHHIDGRTRWTPDDVAAECRSLARQVEAVQELLERFEQIGWGHEVDDAE